MENQYDELKNELESCRTKLAKLQEANEELAGNLIHVNEKLANSELFKGHFISNVTNEIINPFTSILALAGNIGQLPDGDMHKAKRMAKLIFDEAFQLDFQLKNIFAAALIEAGVDGLKIVTIEMAELCEHVQQYFEKKLAAKSIEIVVNYSNLNIPDEPIIIRSDWDKLELILKNIVSNSIKFSDPDSVIHLDFVKTETALIFEISDQGKGISEEGLKVIFDRFKQLDERINSINTGHGLGLSVVQAYTDMLGGEIGIRNNPEKGITVHIVLPDQPEVPDWDDLDNFLLDSETSY